MTWDHERVWVVGETFPFSTSQVKSAGDRIRRAAAGGAVPDADDLMLLDLYRSSHYPTLRHVQERLTTHFDEKPELQRFVTIATRPLKTRDAIISKLVRDRARLNRIHDIAGARLVVADRRLQDNVVDVIEIQLAGLQPTIVKDCRDRSDELGYRACTSS